MRRHLRALPFALALLALAPGDAHAQIGRRAPARDTARAEPSRDVELPEEQEARRALPAAAPATAASTQPDSVMDALERLEGYAVTKYTGTAASFDADSGEVLLVGPATIDRQGQNIAADSMLTFDRVSGIVCGYGNPVLSGAEGSPISSDQICYDTERRMGMALGARTEFAQNANWFVHGERVFTVGSDVIYSSGTEFTTCDLEVPHYHFRASSFKMVNDQILVARDVTLNFGDVPVFWLPFLVQSLREGRRSGMLTPSFGISDIVQTSTRHTRQVSNLGFFWAINDYTGAEAALDWRSGEWLAVRSRFEYRWTRQFLSGYVNAQEYFRDTGARELTLRTDNGWEPGERTQLRVGGAYASSSEFVRRDTYDPAELNRTLQSNASITHRFMNGANLSLGASRDQQLMAEHITTTLPRVALSLPALTLAAPSFGGDPVELIWTASTNYSATNDDRNELESEFATDRDSRNQSAGLGSTFRFGDLSFSQNVSARDARLHAKPAVPFDTATTDSSLTDPLPAETTRALDWSAALSYQQDLIGSMRVTPQLSVNGQMLQSPRTGDEMITAPVTLNFGAALAADVFGFWPGVGPFERFRHRFSPSISYNFRPSPTQTQLQDSVFGASTRATNAIQLTFSQTFEGKRPAEEAGDSLGAPASDDRAASPDEPRRLPGAQPVRLLSIQTSAIAYDFEAASRGEEGLTTTEISNSIASDLLKNLSLNITHSLFVPVPIGVEDDPHFDLHLEQVSARFGITGESWIFRILGLGGEEQQEQSAEAALDSADTEGLLPPVDNDRGMVPSAESSRGMRGMNPLGSTGTRRADLDYSLRRPRDATLVDEHQQVNATVAFQPTENWSVGWNTGYSITETEFLNNSITLSRALHRWQADFRLLRAQNGNFSFEFEARLSDLPDLRVPYDQRTRGDTD